MTELIHILVPPIVGGVVGYFTNNLAIHMMFRPFEPSYIFGKKLPFTPGLIPAEQPRLAEQIAGLVVDTLITEEDFQQLARRLITEENLYHSVDKVIEALLSELHSTTKLHQLAQDTGDLVSNLVSKSVPIMIERLARKSMEPSGIHYILDHILDTLIENFTITPSMANFIAEKAIDTIFSPENVRINMLGFLTPTHIESIDQIVRTHTKGRAALVLFFVNLKDYLRKTRIFLETQEAEANQIIADIIGSLQMQDVLRKAILNINPRQLSWETITTFKEKLALFIHQHLSAHHQEIITPLIEKLDLPAIVSDTVKRFNPDDIPPETLQKIKQEMTRFIQRYLDRELFSLVERVLETIDLQSLIASKVRNFSPRRLEAMIMDVSRKEMRAIVVLGGVLGFLIGCLQAGMNLVLF